MTGSAKIVVGVMVLVCGTSWSMTEPPAAVKSNPTPTQPSAANSATPDLKDPTLYVVGYAHLDTQWRWCYPQVIREYIPATLHENFAFFDKYPSYVFNFSGSRRYQMMQEYYPEDYAKLKTMVAAGKWYPCGSSVDENDANVPSAESYVRHVLYGNRFFRREFGVASEEYMLPDCFGFPAALPSLLAHCGVKGFSTQKLTWNAVVPIPFKVGVWEGPDGHSVIAALDPGEYTGEVLENLATSEGWGKRIAANGQKSGVFADYHYFGTGDRGGGPTEGSVAMVEKSVGTKGPIKVVSGSADLLFKAVTPDMRKKLPTYKGELQLTEHSAGSITSEAYMKRWNRKNELLADAAERASVAAAWMGGRAYPSSKLEEAWTLVLGSQMHDILPGTSHPRAYDYAWNDEALAANEFGAVLNDAVGVVSSTMDTTATGISLVVFNPLSVPRTDVVEAEIQGNSADAKSVSVIGPDGKAVPAQILGGDGSTVRIAFLASVPSVGFASFDARLAAATEPGAPSSLMVSESQLENGRYVVKLDQHGDVSSIFDKAAKRELLSAPARLGLHYENPKNWPAWNQDWADRQKPAREFVDGPATVRVVEQGPARAAVEVVRQVGGSTFTQRIRLASGGDRVEFDTSIDWTARERSLRAWFPLSVKNSVATYDIQSGTIQRGNAQPKQFEYAFHQWFDLTDAGGQYGVSILSDSKYGSDKPTDDTVRLTLLHTPGTQGGYEDQGTQDVGRHHILYAVSGHAGDWVQGRSAIEAARLNQPMVAFRATSHKGAAGKSLSLFQSSNDNVRISAIKQAEDGNEVVVRLRELSGQAIKGASISAASPIVSAREIDGQERPVGNAAAKDGKLLVDIGAYELRAFALKLADAPVKAAAASSVAVELAFDTDVSSTRVHRTDGSMDGKGRAYPAEQFPAMLTADGMTFNLGSTADGAKNALTCRGQEVKLPAGDFDRIALLVASSGGDVETTLSIAGKPADMRVNSWDGFIGQWDRRLWLGEVPEMTFGWSNPLGGLEPGFVKPEHVVWYASHYNTTTADAYYQYCYIYMTKAELPKGASSIRLPNDERVKVFAISVAKVGAGSITPAGSLSDTLADHTQDSPRIVPGGGSFTDSTEVTIEPRLYWRAGSTRYTVDGSDPTPASPTYTSPFMVSGSTTLKAAVLQANGKMGPIALSKIEVNDNTAPTIKHVTPIYGSPVVHIEFSEPVGDDATLPANFVFVPALAVNSVDRAPNAKEITLRLAEALTPDRPYQLKISGIKDASSKKNLMAPASLEVSLKGPIFTMPDVKKEQYGVPISEVKGLPVKAKDAWTMNMFVRVGKQPPNRTIIAGFGKCEDKADGEARYLAKFANGLQFWSRNRDVEGRTPLDINTWQMLTTTYDGKTLRLYKNGKKIGENNVTLADDMNVINIAPADPWEHKRRFEGDIRQFSIWNSALDEEAIRVLHESQAQR